MRYLTGNEEREVLRYVNEAAHVARGSSCHRAQCGSVIVKGDKIIGRGYNSPPRDTRLDRCFKDDLPKDLRSDRTCCIHAEARAVHDALAHHPEKLVGSRLYFIRLADDGSPVRAGKPYCTICSKLALDAGVAEFVLWHEEGICVYDAEEYNRISFQHTDTSLPKAKKSGIYASLGRGG